MAKKILAVDDEPSICRLVETALTGRGYDVVVAHNGEEALDKVAKLLHLGYPGGVAMQDAAQGGDPKAIRFPRPLPGKQGGRPPVGSDKGHGNKQNHDKKQFRQFCGLPVFFRRTACPLMRLSGELYLPVHDRNQFDSCRYYVQ